MVVVLGIEEIGLAYFNCMNCMIFKFIVKIKNLNSFYNDLIMIL